MQPPSCLLSAVKTLPGPTGAAVDVDGEQQVAVRGPWVLHPRRPSNHRDLQPWGRGGNVPGWLCAECTAQQAAREETSQPLVYLGAQILLTCFLIWSQLPGPAVQMSQK